MSAQGLFAASAAIEFTSSVNAAYKEQAYAQFQSSQMQRQMDEIEGRSKLELRKMGEHAEKVVAGQEVSFIKAGVELSGSAMSVISDTLNDAAQAAYIKQRETDYDLGSSAMEKKSYDLAASDSNLYLKIAAAGLGTAASFGKNMYGYNKGGGAKGLTGANGKDAYGGTTSYSRDYINS